MEEKNNKINDFLEMGKLYLDDNSIDEAIKEFKKGFEIDNKNREILDLLAYSYYLKEDFIEAKKYYKMLSELGENTSQFHYNFGLVHYMLSDISQAEVEFRKALEIKRNTPDPYFYLGEIELEKNHINKAIFNYSEYLKLSTDTEYKEKVLKNIIELLGIDMVNNKGELNYGKKEYNGRRHISIIYYSIFPESKKLLLHYGTNGWQNIHDQKMINITENIWAIVIHLPQEVSTIEFSILTEGGEFDNNKGADWKVNLVD